MEINNAILHRILGSMVVALLIGVVGIFVFDKAGVEHKNATLGQSISINPRFDAGVLIDPKPTPNKPSDTTPTAETPPTHTDPVALPVTQTPPTPAAISQPQQAPQPEPQPQPQQAQPEPELQPARASGWVLRVGTFGNQQNARNLQKSLQTDFPKVDAYIKHLDGKKGKLYVVTLGTWQERHEAERIQKVIQFHRNIKALVVKDAG